MTLNKVNVCTMTPNAVFSLVFISVFIIQALGSIGWKSVPLGMNSGKIKDSQITVSSTANFSSGNLARLDRNLRPRGAWCPEQKDKVSTEMRFNEFIQIDLLRIIIITNIVTQGREYEEGKEFTSKYKISYSDDNKTWNYFGGKDYPVKQDQIFNGNTDVSSDVMHKFKPSINARYIRIHPGYSNDQVCMRFELYGYPIQDIISYSMPQGHRTENGRVHYEDTHYTGINKDGILRNGTGLLMDGIIGPVNSKLLKGKRWVGWKSSTMPLGINITFNFDGLRRFDNVTITVNINSTRQNSLFEVSNIFFGVAENEFSQSAFLRYCLQQHKEYDVKNVKVTLPMCGNTAQFVKMQFFPRGKWLLLSEIKFSSVPVSSNQDQKFRSCEHQSFSCVAVFAARPSTQEPPAGTPTEHQQLSIIIPLVCLSLLILSVILVLLLRRRRSRHPTTTRDVALYMEPSCHVMRRGDELTTPANSEQQRSNEESDHVNLPEGAGYVIPFNVGYEYPTASVAVTSTYTALKKTRDTDKHVYQKLLKRAKIFFEKS